MSDYSAVSASAMPGSIDTSLHRPPMTPAPSSGAPSLKRRRSSAPPHTSPSSTGGNNTILQTVLLSKLSYTIPTTTTPQTPLHVDFPVGVLMAQVLSLGGVAAVNTNGIWASVLKNVAAGSPGADRAVILEEDAKGLADLYSKSVKPWEPSVFAGLLAEWVAQQQAERPWMMVSNDSSPRSDPEPEAAEPAAALPQAHDFFAPALQSKNSTPLPMLANANVNPFNSLDLNLSLLSSSVSAAESPAFTALHGGADFENLLASMQDDQERHEAQLAVREPDPAEWLPVLPGATQENLLPTPPQDAVAIRRESEPLQQAVTVAGNAVGGYSPVSMANSASPYDHPSASSSASASSGSEPSSKRSRLNGPKHIGIPTEPFRPPPPMCMYFHTGFYDLQKDKIGVWRGELMVMNDAFSIMVVGEAGQGKRELWQTEKWKTPLHFPAEPTAASSGDLITVTDLVRQGLVPLTMGMVLCDGQRPGEIDRFVRFVASLHATGTAFRLSSDCPLPIVFIPSKFHAEDPLQRLGIAVMGTPPPPPSTTGTRGTRQTQAIRPKGEVQQAQTQQGTKKKNGRRTSK